MSLKWYRRPRLVALKPATLVLEAGRAIEHNNIGAVIVQAAGRVVGIVTDRDLAIRVVGRGLDPKNAPLAEVMTTPVVVLSPADTRRLAIRLMRERNIRRIPLVEGERLVGIVTLDDLLIDEVAPLDELAAVVEAQIGEGGPAPAANLRRPRVPKRPIVGWSIKCGRMPAWKRRRRLKQRSKLCSTRWCGGSPRMRRRISSRSSLRSCTRLCTRCRSVPISSSQGKRLKRNSFGASRWRRRGPLNFWPPSGPRSRKGTAPAK